MKFSSLHVSIDTFDGRASLRQRTNTQMLKQSFLKSYKRKEIPGCGSVVKSLPGSKPWLPESSGLKKKICPNGSPVSQILACNRQMFKLQIQFESQLSEKHPWNVSSVPMAGLIAALLHSSSSWVCVLSRCCEFLKGLACTRPQIPSPTPRVMQ